MKTFIFYIIFAFSSLLAMSQPSGVKTATFAVKGNCEECKKRIENAADIKGVKLANWSENKQLLEVTYNADKVTLEQIESAVAASGHDTRGVKSTSSAYNKLPSCCKYRDKKCETPK